MLILRLNTVQPAKIKLVYMCKFWWIILQKLEHCIKTFHIIIIIIISVLIAVKSNKCCKRELKRFNHFKAILLTKFIFMGSVWLTVTVIVIRICSQQPTFIKIEPSVIQRPYQANTSRGFIIHSIAVVTKSAERYDQVKIKTKKRQKNIVASHDSVGQVPVKSNRIVGIVTGRLLGRAWELALGFTPEMKEK